MALVATENGAYDSLDGAPTPAASGEIFTVHNASLWPDPAVIGPYTVSFMPSGVVYDNSVGERVRVYAKSGAVLSGTRAVEGSTARTLAIGWQVFKSWGAQDGRGALAVGDRNLLINPGFSLCQPIANGGATLATGGAHGPDGWYALSQTGNMSYSRYSPPTPAKGQYAGLLQNTSGGAQRMLMLQVVPAWRTIPMRGEVVRFDILLAGSTALTARIAILEWTGTADAVTKTIVNDWTSSSYTPGGFFTSTTKNVLATSTAQPVAGTTPQLASVVGTVGASANNLIVCVWTTATVAANVQMGLMDAWLVPDTLSAPFTPRDRALELKECQQYYCKSFELDTTPAQNVGAGTGEQKFPAIVAGAVNNNFPSVPFPVRMRAVPTVTFYSSANASAQVWDANSAVAFTGTTILNASQRGFTLFGTGNAGTVVGNQLAVHWSADARL